MKTTIHLGYELGTGRAVEIPLRHTAVTGQTQESGKTTTLEGLIHRSGLRAIAYVTKRGESSFHVASPIPPYFRERTDWPFVAAILEATMSEKLKFQRSWIMKLCEAHHGRDGEWPVPHSLAEVQRNVETALEKAKGLNESVYTELREYLKMVVPEISRLPYSTELKLAPGVNVMNLSDYSFPLQALVVRSVIEWVHHHEEGTISVIPEAWKFAPKQRSSPVRLAAEELIREGAALKNFIWLDSQDIAGVADVLLRQVGVWIFGVQRAKHELERTIDHIPDSLKARPRRSDIATLAKGQFIVCFDREMYRVYVQPAWMSAAHAEAIARGEEDVNSARDILRGYDAKHPAPKETVTSPSPSPRPTGAGEGAVDWKSKYEAEARRVAELADTITAQNLELERLRNDNRHAVRTEDRPVSQDVNAPNRAANPETRNPNPDLETVWAYIKARAADDPAVIAVMARRPEIEVNLTREKITVDGKTLAGRVATLVANRFFDAGRKHTEIRRELERTGPQINSGNLSTELKKLKALGFLTEETGEYKTVAGMKAHIKEL